MSAPVRVAVVDDDAAVRARMRCHLHRFERENAVAVEVAEYGDGGRLLAAYRPTFDVLFLDVRMLGVDGIEVAERVREVDSAVEIVFVTNLPQYATAGYRVRALDYLLKPLTYERFRATFARALSRRRRAQVPHLVLDTERGLVRVGADEVLYLESGRRRTVVHGLDLEVEVQVPLKTFEARLREHGFSRINVGLLVNLQHVVALAGARCQLADGTDLTVSRARRRSFLDELIGHLGTGRP